MSRRVIALLAVLWLTSVAAAYFIGHEIGEPERCPRPSANLMDECFDPDFEPDLEG